LKEGSLARSFAKLPLLSLVSTFGGVYSFLSFLSSFLSSLTSFFSFGAV